MQWWKTVNCESPVELAKSLSLPNKRIQYTFLSLVVVQGIHSLEEYVGKLYDVFLPARVISSLISSDRQQGFIIANVALVSFGLWCYLWPVRGRWSAATSFLWLWIGIELLNGIGHPLWAIYLRQYTPGLATAPLLLGLAIYLARQLTAQPPANKNGRLPE